MMMAARESTDILKSEKVRRLLLAPTSILVVLVLIEFPAFVKIVNYASLIGPKSHDVFATTNRDDPELLHIHPPHSHFSGQSRGGAITTGFRIPQSDMDFYQWNVQYDHNGFRNPIDLESADIIIIGDSFVEGLTVPDGQLITSILGHLQSQVVANLGQYGYGPLEELPVLKRYGLPLRPRTVVWMFFEGNDLKDVIHYHRATTPPQQRPSFWRAFWGRSFARNALAQIYVQFKRALKPGGAKCSAVIQIPGGRRTVYFLYSPEPLSGQDLAAIGETTRTIASAQQLSAAQGARLVFVFIPTKFRVYRSFCQFPKGSECPNWVLNDLPDRLEHAVKSISPEIGYLNLTPDLMNAVQKGVMPYYPDDDHWSPEGNKVAAEAIHRYLSGATHH